MFDASLSNRSRVSARPVRLTQRLRMAIEDLECRVLFAFNAYIAVTVYRAADFTRRAIPGESVRCG